MSFDKYRLRGIVESIGPRHETPAGFAWREVVITDGSASYPQHLPIAFQRDRARLPEDFAPGDVVDVEFVLRGRQSGDGRSFAQVVGIRMEGAVLGGSRPPDAAGAGAATAPTTPGAPTVPDAPGAPTVPPDAGGGGAAVEDLPF